MRSLLRVLVCGFTAAWLPLAVHAATEIVDRAGLQARVGIDAKQSLPLPALVKVAVLDNGFQGFAPGSGLLPSNAELVPGPGNDELPTAHGLAMAQIVWALSGMSPLGPQFYLLNANGFTNFKAAVDFIVRNRVDIVLYSQVWTFGSNFDGTGFINAEVRRAVEAGAIWINASGNFARSARGGSVLVELPGRFRVVNGLDENELSITLSWTDFQDSENHATKKDLDLFLYNEAGKLVASSELVQRGEAPPVSGGSTLSSHARERLAARGLERGTYFIEVKPRSSNFQASDRYRILIETAKPGSFDFVDRSPEEEIFPPADSPEVITVGEGKGFSSSGPTADRRVKPEVVVADSTVKFTSGLTVSGSSAAAAMFAGAVVLLKTEQPGLGREGVLDHAVRTKIAAEEIARTRVPVVTPAPRPAPGAFR